MPEKTMKILGWIGGTTFAVLGLALTIYTTFHVPLASALSVEKEQRTESDACIRKELTLACDNQQKQNETTNIALAKIITKLEYIECKIK